MTRPVSRTVHDAAQAILRWLRDHERGATKAELAEAVSVSAVTVQRALIWLRDGLDAPIVFDRAATPMRWRLTDERFSLPLFDPVPRDLQAVLFASSLLEPVADRDLVERLHRLVEEMDQRVRDSGARIELRPGTVTATISQGQPVDHDVLEALLRAIGRAVVTFDYTSPWSPQPGSRSYDVEPWQLRIHDNRVYLRGWALNRDAPRSFRVAHMSNVRVDPARSPRISAPPRGQIWGDGDPAFGIDHDRPDVGVIRLRGPVARWAAHERWHDEQVDRWIDDAGQDGPLLERTVPYASCREFARRLMSVADGVVSISPPSLRDQVAQLAASVADRLGPSPNRDH